MSQAKENKDREVIEAARLLHDKNKTFQAVETLEKFRGLNESAGALALLAHYNYILRQYDAARIAAEKALRLQPSNRLALHTMGELAMKSRDLDAAEAYFGEVVARGSNSALPYQRLADIHMNSRRYDAAVDALNLGLERHSGSKDLQDKLLYALTMAGRITEADRLRREITLHRDPDTADMSLLLNRFEKLEPGKIIEQLKILASFESYKSEAMLFDRLSYHLMNENRSDEAIPYLEQLSLLQPRNDNVRLRLAEALVSKGDLQRASSLLDEVERYRSDFKIRFTRLQFLVAANRHQEAMKKCIELLREQPRNKRLREILLALKRSGIRPES